MGERVAAVAREPAQAHAPPSAHAVLQTGGAPLAAETRAQLEPRLGRDFVGVKTHVASPPPGDLRIGRRDDRQEAAADAAAARALRVPGPASAGAPDFSAVRVHTGPAAAASARDIGARAYTVGHQIVFGEGEYRPGSRDGCRLLAHELAHVAQQSAGRFEPRLRRQPTTKPKKRGAGKPGVTFWFSVRVDKELNSDQLLVEFVRQYLRLATTKDAVETVDRGSWRWKGAPQSAGSDDVLKGYIAILVHDFSLAPKDAATRRQTTAEVKRMSPEAQAELNETVDSQFWDKTQYKVGTKLGNDPQDERMSEYWLLLRDELIRQRREIEALPPAVRRLLFDDKAPRPVKPADYDKVLRIAHKLAALSDAELEDYKKRVTGTGADMADFERSVDRYVRERRRRNEQAKDTQHKRTRLYGLEDLYEKYKTWKRLKGSASAIPSTDEFGVRDPAHDDMVAAEASATSDFMAALSANKFDSVEQFERVIRDYQDAFAQETVEIAFDMLDHYEHLLYEEEKKFTDMNAGFELGRAVGRTSAKADYEQAAEADAAARGIRPDPDLHRFMPGEFEMKRDLTAKAKATRGSAASAVKQAAADPIVNEPDFDREALANAEPDEVRSMMLDYIAERRKDVRRTRDNLESDPDLIFSLDDLLKQTLGDPKDRPNTIYTQVVNDKIASAKRSGLAWKIAVAIFAVVLGLFSFGTGTVAVLAAVGAFSISAIQAIQSFHEYEVAHAAHGAKLLSEDPSFAWVIVSMVGAGIDLGVALTVVKNATKAIETFNAFGDLVKLEEDLKAIEGVTQAMRQNVVKAAAAEKEFRAAARGLIAAGSTLKGVLFGSVEGIGELVKVIYYGAKKGALSLERLMLTLRQEKLLTEAALEPGELARLRELFEEATTFSEEVAAHGKSLGMTERQIDGFIELWSKTQDATLDAIKADMTAWSATKKSGIPFGFATAEHVDAFRNAAVKGLKKAGYSDAEAILQGSSVSGVSYAKKIPFRAESDFDVAIASRSLFDKARKAKLPVESNPMRIGPLSPESVRDLGLVKLQRDLEAAAGSGHEVKFMLFGNRGAAESGIAGVRPESLPLK